MSYCAPIHFRECPSLEKAYEYADRFTFRIFCCREPIIDTKKEGCPSIFFKEYKQDSNRLLFETADRYWLYNLFRLIFVYYKKYNLLAFIGLYGCQGFPLFPLSINFQNSSDRYPKLSKYTEGNIPYFKDKVKYVRSMDVDTILKYYRKSIKIPFTKDEIKDTIRKIKADTDHYRRNVLYTLIENELKIKDLIYGKYNQIFKIFSMTSITSERDEKICYDVLKHFLKEQ